MKIYIDDEFKCHVTNPNGDYKEVETDFFNNKCNAFIEGYYFVPESKSGTCSDGVVFQAKMVAPWKPYDELDAAQREYEREKLADAENALAILLGGVV